VSGSEAVRPCERCGRQRVVNLSRFTPYCYQCSRDTGYAQRVSVEKPPPGPWTVDAACLTAGLMPDSWWPEVRHPRADELAQAAIAVCGECPVQRECLEHALSAGEVDGIWGGLLPSERRQMARARKQTREAAHWQAKAEQARQAMRPLRREA
jgi:WhiB family transcriptional regulator, redox-sensing transcriptional regulator